MRTALLSFLIFILLAACQSADVGPVQLLYKTWQRQPVTSTGASQLFTFRADGQVRYGVNQNEIVCCLPNQFKLTNNQLFFFTGSVQSVCAYVSCAASPLFTGSPWLVETLTNSDLVIRSHNQLIIFRAQ